MCDPATILSVGGAVMGAFQSYQQSKAIKGQAEYQATVADNNRIIAERNAEALRLEGDQLAAQHRLKGGQLAGRQKVSLAGQGVDLSTGTSVDLLAETAELTEFDAQVIRGNAEKQAYNAEVQGYNFGAQSGLYQAQADAQNPLLSGASSLLTGVGSVASRWYNSSAITTPSVGFRQNSTQSNVSAFDTAASYGSAP